MEYLSQKVKTVRMKPDGTNFTGAAGATDLTSDVVDTQGYDGVRFKVAFGAIVSGGVVSVKAQQGAAANMSDGADLEGTSQTVADTADSKVFIVEIYRPEERYLRVKTLRATQDATVDYMEAELFGGRVQPVTQDATVGGLEIFNSPPEGTA